MKLYIRQKVFSWTDRFTVMDEAGLSKYYVEGELFSFGKKLHVYDMTGAKRAFVQQKVFSFLPRYFVFIGEEQVAEIVKEFTFFRQQYTVEVSVGKFQALWAHDYEIVQNGRTIVTIHKEWMTWGDCYELDIAGESDEIIALAVVLAIDSVLDAASSK